MNISQNVKTYTASEARGKLYSLVKSVGDGLATYEITLRGSQPVILVNRAELEAWQETLDILLNKKEIASIRRARKQKRTIKHEKVLKMIK